MVAASGARSAPSDPRAGRRWGAGGGLSVYPFPWSVYRWMEGSRRPRWASATR